MLDSIQSLLDAFPDGVVQERAGLVLAANGKARQYLPQLTPGSLLPDCIPLTEQTETVSGVFSAGAAVYLYSCAPDSDGAGHVILFRPDPQAGLKSWQLEGALGQLRDLLGEILAEVGPAAVPGGAVPAAAFGKTFHRLFRLVSNLEFMQRAEEEGVPFRPVTMDLDGLCRHTVQLAGSLLREAGVSLEYQYRGRMGLLIPGDPDLLQKLLLSLISNAAQAAGAEGRVVLALHRQGNKAVIALSNSGAAPSQRQLSAIFREGPEEDIPLPGQGAGLGVPIVRHILRLHGGSMVVLPGGGPALSVMLSLPAGPLNNHLELHSPSRIQRDGGLDPVLTELSDVLPAHLFGMEVLD